MRKSVIVGLIFILSVALWSRNVATSPTSIVIGKHYISILSDYVVHAPIVITSDADFETQGWVGNGTIEEPYIIENLSINGNKSTSCIAIFNTTVHFVVRNCLLFNASGVNPNTSGVYWDWQTGIMSPGINSILLYNVTNGLIEHNRVVDNWSAGIFLVISHNNILDSNDILNNRFGLYLWGSDNNTITNNIILGGHLEGRTSGSSQGIHMSVWYIWNDPLDETNVTYVNSEGNYFVENKWANWTLVNAEASWFEPADTTPYNPNIWDDGIGSGNFWDDYNGTGIYEIQGNTGEVDHYPHRLDMLSPIIDNPDDIEYMEGSMGNTIVWSPFDLNPTSFQVLRDGMVIASDIWNGSIIEVDVDGLLSGTYNYTLIVFDILDNWTSDTVLVTVTATTTTTVPTTTTSTPTSPTTPEGFDMMMLVLIGLGGGAIAVIAVVIVFLRRNVAG